MLIKHILIFIFVVTALHANDLTKDLPPGIVAEYYYDYSTEEMNRLRTLDSKLTMSKERLEKWDKALMELAKKYSLIEEDVYRISTYLYTAQRDAAFLSYDSTSSFKGSLDPISLAVIRLFYPFYVPSVSIDSDDYSYELVQIIFPNFKLRFNQETKNIDKEKRLMNIFAWTGYTALYNKSTLGWIPWVMSPIAIEDRLSPIKQRRLSSIWIKRHDLEKQNWLYVTNHYLYSHPVPFSKTVFVRSILALALYDAIITNVKLQHFYNVWEVDASPAPPLHTTLGETAAAVLDYYFPEN